MSENQSQSRPGLPPRRPSGLPSRRDIIRARQEAEARARQAAKDDAVGDVDQATVEPTVDKTASAPGGAHRHPQTAPSQPAAREPELDQSPHAISSAPTHARPHAPSHRGAAETGTPAVAGLPKPGKRANVAPPALAVSEPSSGVPATINEDPLSTGVRSRRIEKERKRLQRRRRNAKIRTGIILFIVAAIIIGCSYIAYSLLTKQSSPVEAGDYPGPGSGSVEFVINPGDSGATIGANLVKSGVVKTQDAFLAAWNDNAEAASIQPGTYQLKKEMRAVDAVAALLDETRRSSNAVSVVPGATVKDVASRMKAFAKFQAKDVDAAFADTAALGLPAEAKGNLEGWLAPGTYEIHTDDKPVTVLKRMVQATVETLESLKVPRDQWHAVLTKASILDMEVNIDRYLPQVARVIENRLDNPTAETAGFLNMDSTVNYGVGRSGGIPTSEDLQKDTPYNTYLHKGLPPTPIASPSKKAIEATLNPAPGNWLYFVTVNLDTGETKFAATKAEHEANIAELTKWCEEHKGKC